MRRVRFLFATIFQNSGDATRALEIAKVVRDYAPQGCEAEIIFLSRGSRFEQAARSEGFGIFRAEPVLGGVQYLDDFRSRFGELIGEQDLAREILRGEMEAYETLRPDVLVYGFWPIGSIAHRMVIPRTPSVAFLPLPLSEPFLDTLHSFPEEMPLSRLAAPLQRALLGSLPRGIKERIPALRHRCIRRAAEASGWSGEPLRNIFAMLRPDLYLVNDLPDFYPASLFGEHTIFTGPLFSTSDQAGIEDERIRRILSPDNPKPKLFCSLGSSGSKRALLEAVRVFNREGSAWSGVVLCPEAICPLEEAQALLRNADVVLTDAFVPAARINALSDAVICHGGQGTLQTAMMSGTPLVGVASQPEQQINLQHLADYGAAIRVPRRDWNARNIARAVASVLREPGYRERAERLRRRAAELTPRRTAAEQIWRRAALR